MTIVMLLIHFESGYKSLRSKIGPENKAATYVANNYAVALMGMGEKKEAERVLKKIVSSGVKDTSVLYNYAILLVDFVKERREAIRIISRLKFNTDDPVLLRKIGKIEKRLDKL